MVLVWFFKASVTHTYRMTGLEGVLDMAIDVERHAREFFLRAARDTDDLLSIARKLQAAVIQWLREEHPALLQKDG